MTKKELSEEERKERETFWQEYWQKPVYQKISKHIPKCVKNAKAKCSAFFERRVPKLTKAGGDAATSIGIRIKHFKEYSPEDQKEILDVDKDAAEDIRKGDKEAEVPKKTLDCSKRAPADKGSRYSSKEDFINEPDIILYTTYLSRRLEKNLCYILNYAGQRKPPLAQMLHEANHYGFIENMIYQDLDQFRMFRNRVIHEGVDEPMTDHNKLSWVCSVFSLEKP